MSLLNLHPNYKKRVFGLDLMRALAIMFVILGHAVMLQKADTNFPWIPLIDGVNLFFVLSGFLIGGIIIKTFDQPDPPSFKTIKTFWIRRWFRTLPNYYLILIINLIFAYFALIPSDPEYFNWKYLFFIQNFHEGFGYFFLESWSLSIEEWFYLSFPILLTGLLYGFKKRKISFKNTFLIAVITFLVIPFLLRLWIALPYDFNTYDFGVHVTKVVIFRLDSIAFGLLAAFIKRYYSRYWNKEKNSAFALGIVISYLALYADWPAGVFETRVLKYTIEGIGCMLLLPKFDSIKTGPKWLVKPTTHISLISYSMYLINLSLVALLIDQNTQIETESEAWLYFFVYLFIVLLGSTIIYKYFEKPMTEFRERFS